MKLLKFGMVGVMAFTLLACESKEPQSAKCTGVENDYDINIKIEAEGKKVVRQLMIKTLDIPSDWPKDELLELIDEQADKVEDIDGFDFKYKIKDDQLIITIDMDIKNGDLEEMVENGVLALDEEIEKGTYIDFKSTIEQYEDRNFTCK